MAVSHSGTVRARTVGSRQIACNTQLIACPFSKTVAGVWCLKDLSNQPLQLSGHNKIITCVSFGNKEQNQLLCTASEDHVYIWNITKGYPNYISGCHDSLKPLCVGKDLGTIQHISFNSADLFISICIEKEVWVLNIEKCQLDSVLEGHTSQLTQAQFCPWNEFMIISIAEDRTFKVWDIHESSLLYQSPIISGFPLVSLTFDVVKHTMAVGATDSRVRLYDLKHSGGFRCLHEMDVCQKMKKFKESKAIRSQFSVEKGPTVISSQPSWQKQNQPDQESDEPANGMNTEADRSVLGLFFMEMTTQTAAKSELSKLPFLNTTQVKDIFDVSSILLVGMTDSIALINCNTWDLLHVLDFQDPILSRNELDCAQYHLPTVGSYAFSQTRKNSVHCLMGSLFHNAAHIIEIEMPTADDDTIDVGLSTRVSKSVGLHTQEVCTTELDKYREERLLNVAIPDQPIITVLSSAPLLGNSPLKAELVPKAQTPTSKKTTKKVPWKPGMTQDQPLTFKSKVKSSGYGDAPRSTMFSPKTTIAKKTSISLKKPASSNPSTLVLKEYPMECKPPTLLRDKLSLTSKPTAVNCVAYSSNGNHLACALGNKSAHLLRVPVSDSSKHTVFTGHDGSLTSVQFSHDDKWLLSSSTDRTVRLWSPPLSDPLLVFDSVNHNFTGSDSDVKGKDKDYSPFPKEVTRASFYYVDKFVLISSGNGLYMYKFHIDSRKDDIKRYQSNSKYKLVKLFQQQRAQAITCFSCVNSFHSCILFVSRQSTFTSSGIENKSVHVRIQVGFCRRDFICTSDFV